MVLVLQIWVQLVTKTRLAQSVQQETSFLGLVSELCLKKFPQLGVRATAVDKAGRSNTGVARLRKGVATEAQSVPTSQEPLWA